jgi:ATP-dependent Clp protease ATP-binding subunit ClpA
MFDRFSERARQTMSLARQASQRLQNDFIGTQHLLLGLLAGGDSTAIWLLKSQGVDVDSLRTSFEASLPRGGRTATLGQVPFTRDVKHVLEAALDASQGEGRARIGTEHLLLGLLRVEDSVVTPPLSRTGVTLDSTRRLLDLGAADEPPARSSEEARGDVHVATAALGHLVARARPHAERRLHPFLGTEHLLLALVEESTVAELLAAKGATADVLEERVNRLRGNGSARDDGRPFTESAGRALRCALEAWQCSRRGDWSDEHLLLGLTRVPEGLACTALDDAGVDVDALRADLEKRLGAGPADSSS